MPTLDDTTTLQSNVALAGNDSLVISNKDSKSSSQIQQVPAGMVGQGFSHAWLVNYDNTSIAATTGHAATNIDLHTFAANDRVNKVRLCVTKAFTGPSLSAVSIVVGVNDDDVNGYIESASGFAVGIFENTGDLIDSFAEVGVTQNNPTDADTLRVTVDPTGCDNADLTGGQFVILANIVDPTSYADLVPAT